MEKVYFTKAITPESVLEIINKAKIQDVVSKNDLCAIKTHFGEKNNKGYIKPELIKPIIKKIKQLGAHPFITDANTIYVGERSASVRHMMMAYEHKFNPESVKCPVIIADGLVGNSYENVEVNLKHFKKVEIAEAIYNAGSIVCVTHVKGHLAFGMGGAIKNIGMGCAARTGKFKLHSTVEPKVNADKCTSCGICVKNCPGGALTLTSKTAKISFDPKKCIGCGECVVSCKWRVFDLQWNEAAVNLCEKTVEYAAGALKNKKALYVNIVNYVTKNCDCMSTNETPLIDNVGIFASTDIVAVDQASVDAANKHYGSDVFKHLWPKLDYEVQLDYAEKLGLGSRKYELEEI